MAPFSAPAENGAEMFEAGVSWCGVKIRFPAPLGLTAFLHL